MKLGLRIGEKVLREKVLRFLICSTITTYHTILLHDEDISYSSPTQFLLPCKVRVPFLLCCTIPFLTLFFVSFFFHLPLPIKIMASSTSSNSMRRRCFDVGIDKHPLLCDCGYIATLWTSWK